MIEMKFRVRIDGAEQEVVAGPVTQVAYEREHKRSLATLADSPMISDLYWLAWHALSRTRQCGTFDEFLERIENVEAVGEDAPGPLAGQA